MRSSIRPQHRKVSKRRLPFNLARISRLLRETRAGMRPLRSARAWNDAALVPPPTDGTEIVASGNLSYDEGNGATGCHPFTRRLRWREGCWMDLDYDVSLAQFTTDEVHIHHWIATPNNDTAKR